MRGFGETACGAVKDAEHQPCHLREGHPGSHESVWLPNGELHLWMPLPEPNTLISGDWVAPGHVPG